MAVLATQDRIDLWAELMQELSREREVIAGLTKADLKAAVDALDDWLNTNAAAINTAIPQPARANLTTSQKARLLARIIHKRFVKGA